MRTGPGPRFKLLLQRFFKTVIIVAPFAYVIHRLDVPLFVGIAHQTAWWTLPASTSLTLLVMVLQGLRWHVLLAGFLDCLPFSRTLSVYFKSLFYSLVLPSSAGQDVARAVLLAREKDYRVVWGSTWVCRVLGLSVLAVLALIGLLLLPPGQKPLGLEGVVYAGFATILMVVGLSFSKVVTSRVRPLFDRILPARLAGVLAEVRQAIYLYRFRRRTVVVALILTLVTQLVVVLNAAMVIAGICGGFPFLACLVLVPLVEIVSSSVPLTPGGVGVRETLVLVLFDYVGLNQEQIALYMVFGLLGMVLRVLGVVPVVLDLRRQKTTRT